MHWLFGRRMLAQLGILAMNRRNAACILDHNPRALFPMVDDKLRMADACKRIGVATPDVYAAIEFHSQLRHLPEILADLPEFVIKPNRGSAGRGGLGFGGRAKGKFVPPNPR